MEWLNYHHLYYFWVVVKEGSITAACQHLRVTQPTVSAQIMTLEESLGCELFSRSGRRLSLTEAGRTVFRDADEIFSLGREMVKKLSGQVSGMHRLPLTIGITSVMPKLLAFRLLQPALQTGEPIKIVCHEGKHADLLAKLSVYELDILLTDAPIGSEAKIKAFNHLLGECGVSVFAARSLKAKYTKDFPRSLHRAPFIVPIAQTSLRRALNNWFGENEITPTIVGEFEESALIKIFGQSGLGLFVMPTVEEHEVLRQYDVKLVGRLAGIKVRYYAISTERKVRSPLVLAITEAAHKSIFD